jgi:hypothetical protein
MIRAEVILRKTRVGEIQIPEAEMKMLRRKKAHSFQRA